MFGMLRAMTDAEFEALRAEVLRLVGKLDALVREDNERALAARIAAEEAYEAERAEEGDVECGCDRCLGIGEFAAEDSE